MSGVTNYPNAPPGDLRAQYVGRLLQDIDGPAAIIDVAVARRNCQLMLDAAEKLGLTFRSHVKTHKVSSQSCSRIAFSVFVDHGCNESRRPDLDHDLLLEMTANWDDDANATV